MISLGSLASSSLLFSLLMAVAADVNHDGPCTKVASSIWKFSTQYFKEQRNIAVVSDNHHFMDFNEEIMKCSMQNIITPVSYNVGEWDLSTIAPRKEGRLIFEPRIEVGLILISDTGTSLQSTLEQTATLNIAKLIIVLINGTSSNISNILRKSWQDYDILNLVIIHGIGKNTHDFEISAYDPFTVGHQTRGDVKTYKVNDQKMLPNVVEELNNRLRKVCKYPIKICMFELEGISVPVKNKQGSITRYTSLDGELIHTLMKTIDFNPIYLTPRDSTYYSNSSLQGALRDLEEGLVDIAGNVRLVNDYGQMKTDFLVVALQADLGFLTPKIDSTTHVSFLDIFSVEVSAAITGAFVLMVVSWKCLHKISQTLTDAKVKRKGLIKMSLTSFGNILLISQPEVSLWYERYLFLGWTFFSMIICFSYQATMLEHLVASVESRDFNTMQALADSDLKIVTFKHYATMLDDIAALNISPGFYRQLASRTEVIPTGTAAMHRVAFNRDAALFFTRVMCKVYQAKLVSNKSRSVLTHVLEEGPPARLCSHMVRRNSPYKDRFNEVILQIEQSGLIAKWLGDTYYNQSLKVSMVADPSDEKHNVYTVKELSFIFLAWLGCCSVCCVVFILEIVFVKFIKKK